MSDLRKIQNRLKAFDIDALLLISPVNRYYATNFRSSSGAALITESEAFFITDSRYIEAARSIVTGAEVFVSNKSEPTKKRLADIIKTRGLDKVGIEEKSLSHSEYLAFESCLPAALCPAEDLILSLRESKEPWEVNCIREAQRIAESAYEHVLGIIKPGVAETEIAAELVYAMLRAGAEKNSFDPIVVTGRKTSMPHGEPGNVPVRHGDFITMDFGCVKNGYCSDMTRTVAVGAVTDEMKNVYGIVLEAQLAGIAAARAGVPGREIDEAARSVISAHGYGPYFGHGFGHSLGLEVHEGPNAAPGEERIMPVGAVISAEPGIYIPGEFGVRIEDTIYLTEEGCENLTSAAKNLLIL